MARWEPNAQERLTLAALELFVDQGYDKTTVAEITERAGLTKRTFFRHFADKREVLFAGQDVLLKLFTEAITNAPGTARPLEAVLAALVAAGETAFTEERLEFARRRQSVVEANDSLRERELLKGARLTAATAEALRARGVADLTARLAAEVGNVAFVTAFGRWVNPKNRRDFATLAQEAVGELRKAAASLR